MNLFEAISDHKSADLLRRLLDGSREAVVCEDWSSRIVVMNPRFLAMVGWSEPYSRQTLDDLVSAWASRVSNPGQLYDYFARCRSTLPPSTTEELQPHNGQVIEARYQTLELNRKEYRIWYFQEWKTAALAWVSHEIKNPLNAVLGFSELLDKSLSGYADPGVQESLKGLRVGAKHLQSVLHDVLDLSRLESGVIRPQPEWVSVRTFLDDLAALYRSRIRRRELEFVVEYPADPNQSLWIDAARLSQVLGNLLSNSLRFTKRGWIALRAIQDDTCWTFQVEDSGDGIEPDQQKTIFEPFVQQSGQDPHRFGGSGLGLAICRTLTRSLGGSLNLRSRPGAGSCFSVSFDPLPSRPTETVPDEDTIHLPATELMVVDDEPSNHLLIQGYLRGTPVHIVSAFSGNQAVALWNDHKPKAVLVDLNMPGMSGSETALTLKSREPNWPGVYLAMSANTPHTSPGTENWWKGFLEKPFGRVEFLKFLSKYLTFVDGSC